MFVVEEKRLVRENQLLVKCIRDLSQREVEEALFDRRVKLENLIDWQSLPRFTPNDNGIHLPVSKNNLHDLYTQLEKTIKSKT